MDFQTKMLLGTFAVTVLLGLIIVPILRKLKVGQIERTDGPQSHLKKQGTPTMGGIIIMLGIIIATCCAYVYYKGKDASLAKNLIPILCLTTGFGIIGFIAILNHRTFFRFVHNIFICQFAHMFCLVYDVCSAADS